MSRTVEGLLRRSLRAQPQTERLAHDPRTGFTVIYLDQPITSEDVRSLEDDE